MALQSTGSVQGLPGQMGKVRAESRYSAIGLINLDEKQTGAPSAGNPHAGCEVAGAGTRLTGRILRHFQRKREATVRLNLRGNGASPRPHRRRQSPRDGCLEKRATGWLCFPPECASGVADSVTQ